MLSPHELATLLLVKYSPDQLHMTGAQLDALLERHLVQLQEASADQPRWVCYRKADTENKKGPAVSS